MLLLVRNRVINIRFHLKKTEKQSKSNTSGREEIIKISVENTELEN